MNFFQAEYQIRGCLHVHAICGLRLNASQQSNSTFRTQDDVLRNADYDQIQSNADEDSDEHNEEDSDEYNEEDSDEHNEDLPYYHAPRVPPTIIYAVVYKKI